MHTGVGGDSRADVDAYRRCVNELYVLYPLCVYRADMLRQRPPLDHRGQSRDKTFQHHRRFPGAGHAGDDGEPSFRNIDLQGLHRVYL